MAYIVGMEDQRVLIEQKIWEDIAAEFLAAGCNIEPGQLRWAMLEFMRRLVQGKLDRMVSPTAPTTPTQPEDAALELKAVLLKAGVLAETVLLEPARPGRTYEVYEQVAREIQHCYMVLDGETRQRYGGES